MQSYNITIIIILQYSYLYTNIYIQMQASFFAQDLLNANVA